MIDKLILERRSVRIFNNKKINDEDIQKIIEAGIWAPTGCNNQEIRFYNIHKSDEITEFIKFKPFFRGVSNFILVLVDTTLFYSYLYKKKDSTKNLADIDAGLAIQNMVLKAKDLGIDSCIVNLSDMHYKKEKNISIVQRAKKELLKVLKLHKFNEYSFKFFLNKYLRIPAKYEIKAGIALGYGKQNINIDIARHGKNTIKRKPLEHYLLTN